MTGGSRWIGRAIVERLARDSASVAFGFLHSERPAAAVCAAVAAAGGRAEAVRADQGSVYDVRRLFVEAKRRLGGLDILVINAGTGAETRLAGGSSPSRR